MTISSIFDTLVERVSAGERLGADDLAQLAARGDARHPAAGDACGHGAAAGA